MGTRRVATMNFWQGVIVGLLVEAALAYWLI